MRSVKAAIVGGAVLATMGLAAVPATASPTGGTPATSVAAGAGIEVAVEVVLPSIAVGLSVPGIVTIGVALGN